MASNTFPIYSPKDVKIAWGGVSFQGVMSISYEYNNDVLSGRSSMDGKRSRTLSPDKSGSCTVTIAQESPTNAILSWALASTKNGSVIEASIVIADPSGSSLAHLAGAVIMTSPTSELGEEAGDREYVFDVAELDFIGAPDTIGDILPDADVASISSAVSTLAGKIL